MVRVYQLQLPDVELGIFAVHSIELLFDGKTIYQLGKIYSEEEWDCIKY